MPVRAVSSDKHDDRLADDLAHGDFPVGDSERMTQNVPCSITNPRVPPTSFVSLALVKLAVWP